MRKIHIIRDRLLHGRLTDGTHQFACVLGQLFLQEPDIHFQTATQMPHLNCVLMQAHTALPPNLPAHVRTTVANLNDEVLTQDDNMYTTKAAAEATIIRKLAQWGYDVVFVDTAADVPPEELHAFTEPLSASPAPQEVTP